MDAWFLDSTIGEHWPDAALAALFAFAVWLLERAISRMEKRHERAEDQFRANDQRLTRHGVEIRHIQRETKVKPFYDGEEGPE